MKRWKKSVLALLVATPLLASIYEAADVTVKLENPKFVGPQEIVNVTPSAPYTLQAGSDSVTLEADKTYTITKDGTTWSIHLGTESLFVGGENENLHITSPSASSALRITSGDGQKKASYLGDFALQLESGKVHIYNTLDVEDYLKGVLPHEMSEGWGKEAFEALKAQAVSARSYTMANGYLQKDYITDTTKHQVYGGYSASDIYSHQAVKDTNGETLMFDGKPIATYYSSSNGGFTETNENVWSGGTKLGYLSNEADADDNKYIETLPISQATLVALLRKEKNDSAISTVDAIAVTARTTGNRAKTLSFAVTLANGSKKTYAIEGTRFRTLVGTTTLKSTYITSIAKTNTGFTFATRGYGHGVGMSQWGAYTRAKKGHTYHDILSFYYKNTTIGIIEGTKPVEENNVLAYQVVSGDTLYKIARTYNVTVAELKAWSGLTSDNIQPGWTLFVRLPHVTNPPEPTEPITPPEPTTPPEPITPPEPETPPAPTIPETPSEETVNPKPIENEPQPEPQPEPTPVPVTTKTYQVIKGDTLTKIAKAYGVTVAQIKAWNALTGDNLHIGWVLLVQTASSTPSPAPTPPAVTPPATKPTTPTPATYTVVKGDTMAKIAKKYTITVADIQKWNALPTTSLRVGQVVYVKERNNAKMYTVVRGDTMSAVAKRYGTTVKNIQSWNGLTTTSLKVGQRLKVSSGDMPNTKSSLYSVVRGDTLSAVAKRYGTTVKNLQSWNALNGTSLKVHQLLYVTKPAY